jgi:hypothetical protein
MKGNTVAKTKKAPKGADKPRLKGAGESKNVKELKKNLKRGGKAGYLSRVPADGRTVRFLTEPDKWFKFYEHYDEAREDDRYFPCTEDCVGCDEGLDTSKRWLANALDTSENRVIPQVLPASLVGNLMKKYDKFGTIMDRDYELTKEGSGMGTEYDALYESPKKMKLDRFELLNLEDVLLSQLPGQGDDEDEDDEDDAKPSKPSKGGSKSMKSKAKEEPPAKGKSMKSKAAPTSKGKAMKKKGMSKK